MAKENSQNLSIAQTSGVFVKDLKANLMAVLS